MPPASVSSDGSDSKSPFTITASLREIYDDNVLTSKANTISSFDTDLSPSVLFDHPMENSDISARYTFHMIYYSDRPGNKFDFSHEFAAQYRHSFSDRFSFNVADQFRYFTEPSVFENIGSPYFSGAYASNQVNAGFNAQWTPLFGTITNYSNTLIHYDHTGNVNNPGPGFLQDSMENTGVQSFTFAIRPKVVLVFGGIVDNISYDHIVRGYTSYTGDAGADWQVLPSILIGGRVGGTVTDAELSGTSASPYATATLAWQLGAKSSLSLNYSHEVVPTDVFTAEAQIADRFNALFKYDITPNISSHLQGTLTEGDYTQSLTTPGTSPSFTETDYAIDTGLTYHLDKHFDFDLGYILTGISSQQNFRDYTRDQVYLGVRGTY